MLPKILALLGSFLLVTGCARSEFTATTGNLTQSQVDEILRKCDAPMSMVTLNDGTLTVSIKEADKNLSIFGCVFDALYATGETDLKKLGNEMYVAGKKS